MGSPTRRTFLILASSVQPSLPTRISSSSSHVSPAPEQLKLASQAAALTLDCVEFATSLLRVEAVPAHDDVPVAVLAAPIGIRYKGKGAIKWTRLSCRTFAANAVRLQLHALAYNLATTPEPMSDWSLTPSRRS